MLHRRSPRRKGKDDGERFGEGKKVEVNATKRAVLGRNFSPRNIFIATVMLLTLITTHYLRALDAATAVAAFVYSHLHIIM